MHCNVARLFLHAGAFVCNISSPSSNIIEVTCKLFGDLARVNVILTCINCTGSSTRYSILGDSPVVIPDLPAGNYTADIIAVDIYNNIIRNVEVIVMSENAATDTVSTSAVSTIEVLTTNRATTNVPTTKSNNILYSYYKLRLE